MGRQWEIYRTSLEPTSRERKSLSYKPVSHDVYWSRILAAYNNGEKTYEEVSFESVEPYWVNMGRPTIFVDSAQLIKNLNACNYSVSVDSLWNNFSVVAFSFPRGLVLNNISIRPFIVRYQKNPSVFAFYVRNKFLKASILYIVDQKGVDEILDGTSNNLCFTADEREKMIMHLRLFACMSSYISAFPDALKPGIPEDMKRTNANPKKDFTLFTAPELRGSVSAHFRRAHFMTLRDERYKHNEDGTPRIVFRNSAVVKIRRDKCETLYAMS